MDSFTNSIFDLLDGKWHPSLLSLTNCLKLFYGAQIEFFLPRKDYFIKAKKKTKKKKKQTH